MTSQHRPRAGFRRGPRVADLMTDDYLSCVELSVAAERAGDAETALEYHRAVPMFRRSHHVHLLRQLAGLADEMTPWLWARWAAYQCTRAEDPDTECGDVGRLAGQFVLETFCADEMDELFAAGGDPVPLLARTRGEHWVFHQLCTYDLRGLEAFLDTLATDRLLVSCGLAQRWVDAPMRGYRLERAGASGLVVEEVVSGRSHQLLDVGAAVHAGPGGWLLGRLVPSGTAGPLMFESRPLPVDEQTARACGRSGPGAWVKPLFRAVEDGRVDPGVLTTEDRELVSDVPGLTLLERGTPPGARAAALDQLRRGRDEVGRAAYRILRGAAEGTFGPDDDAPFVAAAALDVHGFAEAARDLVGPDRSDAWRHWAGLVAEPARGRLLRLAEAGAETAA